MRKLNETTFHGSSAAFMENFSSNSEKKEDLEKLYRDKLKEAVNLASDFNEFTKEGKRSDLYHFEKEFMERSIDFNESINRGIMSEVVLFKNLNKEIKSIDDFPESKISKEEWDELYENIKKRKKTELFYKKARELICSLGYKIVKSEEESIILEKGDKVFELEYQVLRDSNTADEFVVGRVGGFGRITYLSIKKGDQPICFFKSRWVHACEDIDTQMDINELVAILS